MIIFTPQVEEWLNFLKTASSLVKVITFFFAWIGMWLPIAFFLAKLIKWDIGQPLTVKQKLVLVASLYLLVPFLVEMASQVEGNHWLDYGLCWQPRLGFSTIVGFLLAVTGLIVVFALEAQLGWLKWNWQNYSRLPSLCLPILALALSISLVEELVFRGWLIYQLQQDYSPWLAALVSSVIFALLHLVWEQQLTLPQIPGLWLMGMVLVYSRWLDGGSLGLPWGLHAGWIWGLSCLDSAELFVYTGKASSWLTGIGKQPLAGIAGVSCLLATSLVLWLFNG